LLIIWIVVSFAFYFVKHFFRIIRKKDIAHSELVAGVVLLLFTNLSVFMMAKQAFADIFVLSFLGFLMGFLLRLFEYQEVPRLIQKSPQPVPGGKSTQQVNLPLPHTS
jgi:hypothetical protein